MFSSSSSSSTSSDEKNAGKRRKTVKIVKKPDFEQFAMDSDSDEDNDDKKKTPMTTIALANATKEVTVHTRKAIWESIYGEARQTRCFLCSYTEIGGEASSFDLAHVVARATGGNNSSSWNRFATCSTCNQKVANNTNLLDFIVENYPKKLIPVCLNLWQRFLEAEPYAARRYFSSGSLELFVRTLYGRNGTTRGVMFFSRYLPDYNDKEQKGRVTNERVYSMLRYYDETAESKLALRRNISQIDKEIQSMQQVLVRLQREKSDNERKLEFAKSEMTRLTLDNE